VNLPVESKQNPVKESRSGSTGATEPRMSARTGQTRESGSETAPDAPPVATPEPSLRVTVPAPRAEDPFGLLAAALEYIGDRHWEVALGTSAERSEGGWSCSCGDKQCAAIGAHPAQHDWQKHSSGQPSKAHEWWASRPTASVLLPTGRAFDVLEVSEAAGCLGLARLERAGVNVGPVAALPTRRMYFFVLPNARAKTVEMLATLGWGRTRLDLVCRGAGDYVVAPPSRMGALGHAQWVRRPSETNSWMPDVEELLAPLAYACGLHR
jgi:Bifunctional DNA primase/polymerase, N-terminal